MSLGVLGKSGLAGMALLLLANAFAPAAPGTGLIAGRSGKAGHVGLALRISLAGR